MPSRLGHGNRKFVLSSQKKYGGTPITVEGEKYLILKMDDLIAIFE